MLSTGPGGAFMNKSFLTIMTFIFLFGSSPMVFGDQFDQDGVLLDDWGIPALMPWPQYGGDHRCPKGMHLPSIREFAKESESRGAKGILELSQVPSPLQPPAGYILIKEERHDDTVDSFYYSNEGYMCALSLYSSPKCSPGYFWSKSSFQLNPNWADRGVMAWEHIGATTHPLTPYAVHARIRCFPN